MESSQNPQSKTRVFSLERIQRRYSPKRSAPQFQKPLLITRTDFTLPMKTGRASLQFLQTPFCRSSVSLTLGYFLTFCKKEGFAHDGADNRPTTIQKGLARKDVPQTTPTKKLKI